MTNTSRKNASSTRGRPFKKGNPGRPRGARNRVTVACESLMAGEGEKLTRKAIELAQGGDTVALRLCLERIYPVRKGRLINLDLPKVESARDVLKAIGSTISAVAEGEITPEGGSLVAGLLETKRKAIETLDIEDRLTRLESLNQ